MQALSAVEVSLPRFPRFVRLRGPNHNPHFKEGGSQLPKRRRQAAAAAAEGMFPPRPRPSIGVRIIMAAFGMLLSLDVLQCTLHHEHVGYFAQLQLLTSISHDGLELLGPWGLAQDHISHLGGLLLKQLHTHLKASCLKCGDGEFSEAVLMGGLAPAYRHAEDNVFCCCTSPYEELGLATPGLVEVCIDVPTYALTGIVHVACCFRCECCCASNLNKDIVTYEVLRTACARQTWSPWRPAATCAACAHLSQIFGELSVTSRALLRAGAPKTFADPPD